MAATLYYDVVSVFFVLAVMILVHEWGHFAAAKLFGVRVEVFSIGFGKRLLGFRRGDTDYRISAIPFGGYVKMSGESPLDQRAGTPDEFMSHPRWQRVVIALAGPFMNILLAVGLLTWVFMVHYEHPLYLDQAAVVGWIAPGSAAEKAGIQPGDKIIQIGSTKNPDWEYVFSKVMISPHSPVELVIQRGDQQLQKTVFPDVFGKEQLGDAGFVAQQPFTVTQMEPSMPAAKSGMQIGDDIVAADRVPVRSTQSLSHLLQQTKNNPVLLTVMRKGQQLDLTVTPQLTTSDDGQKVYRIGIISMPVRIDKLPFVQALSHSIDSNQKNSLLILELVKRMMQRRISIKQMEGPIGIARVSGMAAQEKGWTPLMQVMAAISLNLGIFNLFPIPILDGGLILLLLIESVIRRDISQPIKERIYQAAFVCLILFAGMVIFNDIVKVIPGITHHLQ
ncbi:MAG: RIP metalloprotease RseP [Candidatus Korobacteraceae bacterium]